MSDTPDLTVSGRRASNNGSSEAKADALNPTGLP